MRVGRRGTRRCIQIGGQEGNWNGWPGMTGQNGEKRWCVPPSWDPAHQASWIKLDSLWISCCLKIMSIQIRSPEMEHLAVSNDANDNNLVGLAITELQAWIGTPWSLLLKQALVFPLCLAKETWISDKLKKGGVFHLHETWANGPHG